MPGNNDCTCRANLLERALLGLGGIKEVGDMGAKWVRGALLYFGAVFGAGFLLGLIRVLWLVPQLGARFAELLEMPFMILVSFGAASWVVHRSRIPDSKSERMAMGVLALLLMICAELGVTALLLKAPISDVVTKRDPISGIAYVCALFLFGLMPLFVGRGKTRNSGFGTSIDAFVARPDVSERHEILVKAPPDVVFAVAEHLDIRSIPAVNAIFRLRELVFGTQEMKRAVPTSLVEETQSLGWGVLAFRPGEELVMGAVTQPWVGDVKFRSVPSEEFSKFSEPGFVKIAWTLEVESIEPGVTRFRTQTRVLATDAASRRKFRLYWTFAGPFIVLIRRLVNRAIRQEAERQVSAGDHSTFQRLTKGGCAP